MNWRTILENYEFEGKTTEDAIENASRELNLPVEELSIDIIEPGSAGIFGLVGSRRAKIRVTVKSPIQKIDDDNGLKIAKETLENILSLIPVDTTVNAEQTDGKIALTIEGDKSGLLIGRKGKTLDALQYIVNKVVNKTLEKRTRVVVDSENYRQRRKESLTQLALKMGDKAKRIRKPITTNPMNPHDRRLVHLALQEDENLDTKSRGEGLLKKVIIIPKR
jgi:spoIIIJ-associated protein